MTQQVSGDLRGLKEQILAQARSKGEEILAQAQSQAQQIIAEAKEKGAQEAAKILAAAKSKAEAQQRQLQIAAKLKQNKEFLAVKRALLDRAFAEAQASFAQLPEAEYQQFSFELLQESRDLACSKLVISPGEERITPQFLDRVAKELDWQLELVREDLPRLAAGGFLLRGEKLEIDCTIPTILELKRTELEGEVAQILFGQL